MTIGDLSRLGAAPADSIPPLPGPGSAQPRTNVAPAPAARDAQSPELGTQRLAVNALRDAASALRGTATDAAAEQLTLPPLPPMPAPAKPSAVASDDHGRSNIVFTDGDMDGSGIH